MEAIEAREQVFPCNFLDGHPSPPLPKGASSDIVLCCVSREPSSVFPGANTTSRRLLLYLLLVQVLPIPSKKGKTPGEIREREAPGTLSVRINYRLGCRCLREATTGTPRNERCGLCAGCTVLIHGILVRMDHHRPPNRWPLLILLLTSSSFSPNFNIPLE